MREIKSGQNFNSWSCHVATPGHSYSLDLLIHGFPPLRASLPPRSRRHTHRRCPTGFQVTHAYGLTEATEPALVCVWRDEWDLLAAPECA
ncbi:hypothetical protein Taro_029807 [Colocasia esculenta]|uniref:Uncharacterized protein n=1 Tax=Colocasia esculenta TaxID=4460 RepID=A0A843VJV6_COLES|nr:hypothetical protein [Colocasia esculenta]